MRHNIVEWL